MRLALREKCAGRITAGLKGNTVTTAVRFHYRWSQRGRDRFKRAHGEWLLSQQFKIAEDATIVKSNRQRRPSSISARSAHGSNFIAINEEIVYCYRRHWQNFADCSGRSAGSGQRAKPSYQRVIYERKDPRPPKVKSRYRFFSLLCGTHRCFHTFFSSLFHTENLPTHYFSSS